MSLGLGLFIAVRVSLLSFPRFPFSLFDGALASSHLVASELLLRLSFYSLGSPRIKC